jgi:hypothetical protein
MVEYLCTFPDVADIFNGVKNCRVLLREDIHKAPQFRPGDDHENNRDGIRETARAFYPCHTITKTSEIRDKRLGVIRSYQPDDDMPQRDHLLDLHTEEGTKPITGEIGKKVPVIGKIRQHKTGRKEPDTCLGNADTRSQISMPPRDIDSPDGLKTCFNNPCNEDKEGNCRKDPGDTSADSESLPAGIIVPGY